MKKNMKNRGFTLLELMIAISIFAGLVVLVVGSFAASTSYQRRVKVNREVSQAARNALDSISREVAFSLNQPVADLKYNNEPVYNFAVASGTLSSPIADTKGNILVVRDETDHCRRYYLSSNKRLVVQTREKEGCLGRWREPNFLTNNNVEITSLEFLTTPNTKSSSASYLEIKLRLKNSASFFADELDISMSPETTVTIRNDGQEKL